jgi:hypothetical protein
LPAGAPSTLFRCTSPRRAAYQARPRPRSATSTICRAAVLRPCQNLARGTQPWLAGTHGQQATRRGRRAGPASSWLLLETALSGNKPARAYHRCVCASALRLTFWRTPPCGSERPRQACRPWATMRPWRRRARDLWGHREGHCVVHTCYATRARVWHKSVDGNTSYRRNNISL